MKKSQIDFSKQCTVEELHQIMLRMLTKIDAICEEENIPYFLIDGTLLGAIRHEGFIPWDDDVDIAMPRADYERFIQIASEKLGDDYFVQTIDSDPKYHQFYIPLKIRDNHSTLIEVYGKKHHEGVYIDVFPFDYLTENREEELKQKKITYLFGVAKGPVQFHTFPSIHFFARILLQMFGRLAPEKWMVAYIRRAIQKNQQGTPGEEMIYGFEMPWLNIFKKTDIFPLKKVKFENVSLNVPNNADAVLKNIFGDYMELPPKDKQLTHAKFYSKERLFR